MENDEKSVEERQQEIYQHRLEQEKILSELSQEQQVEYLINMYKNNENIIKKFGLNTIDEDDLNGK